MNDSATNFPHGMSEFDAGRSSTASRAATVRPARVAGAPVAFECRVSGEHEIGDCVMVFGEVLHVAAPRRCSPTTGCPTPRKLAPLSRLGPGGMGHARRGHRPPAHPLRQTGSRARAR